MYRKSVGNPTKAIPLPEVAAISIGRQVNIVSDDFDANQFLGEIDSSLADASNDTPLVKNLRSAIKRLGQEKAALAAKVTEFETSANKAKLDAVWDQLKVPAAIRSMYRGDESSEAIASWWNDSKTLFKLDETPGETPPAGQLDSEHSDLQAFNQAANLGTDGDPDGQHAFTAKAKEVKTKSAHSNPNALGELFSLKPGA